MATRAHTVPKFYLRGFVDPESESNAEPYVWLGTLATGKVIKRSPKNLSTYPGYYDGPGGLQDRTRSLEAHLAQIESDAATAIRKFSSTPTVVGYDPPLAIWRFLAWQAARTPGWFDTVNRSLNEWNPNELVETVEPPPNGLGASSDSARTYRFEDPSTGAEHEARDEIEFGEFRSKGWKWLLRTEDRLEMMHVQAWYFQVRHFPRLSWTRLNTPPGDWFVTSDRAVTWSAEGFGDVPPAALRHHTAQVVAPLTRKTALVGKNNETPWRATPREVNQFVASTASTWIAGPTRESVEQALLDRGRFLPH